MYKVAINALYLVQTSGLWAHMDTHTSLPATSVFNALITAAELIYQAATVHSATHTLPER